MEINSIQHYASLMKSTTPGLLESYRRHHQHHHHQQQQQRRHHNHDDSQLPPGFRFHPTDEELITCYLMRKVVDGSFTSRAIAEIDLNKCEPWELPGKAKMGEEEWYFFSLRDRKYPTGLRTNRATESGYWKATGKDREVVSSKRSSQRVGMKKTLVFYRGRAPKGEKTNWVMHEYRLEGTLDFQMLPCSTKDEWVVCRVFRKVGGVAGGGNNKKSQQQQRITALTVGGKVTSYSETWVDDQPHHHSSSPASLPMLLDSSADGDRSCPFETSGRDHVSCFSTAQAIPVPNPPPASYLFSPPPPSVLGVGVAGVAPPPSPFSTLRGGGAGSGGGGGDLQEYSQMPFFFSSLPPFEPSRAEAAGGAGSWPASFDALDRKAAAPETIGSRQLPVGATELDYMVTY